MRNKLPDLTLELTPHPDRQRTYAELRSEFRAVALRRIHDSLSRHPLGWGVLGDPALARDRFTTAEWAVEMLHRLDALVTQDFGLPRMTDAARHTAEEYLAHWASESILEPTFPPGTPGTFDHDAPPCADVRTMSDDDLCDYIDRSITENTNE